MSDPATTPSASKSSTRIRHKPLMTMPQILLMNLGFFGIQYSFGMQQTAINPIYTMLGASHDELPLLNMAGPITGLLIQPLIGAMSDRTWVDKGFFRGRRRPFFLVGALGCAVCLFLFPFVWAVWMAVLLLWLLDASNNTAMEPYRAFIADKLPPSQLGKGFLAQSFFTGLGITLANLSLTFFQMLFGLGEGVGLPHWVYGAFFVGSVASIATILVSVISTPELEPTKEEIAALRAKKGGPREFFGEIKDAIIDMPVQMRKLALVYFFQWYAMNVYWQYVSLSVSQSLYGSTTGEAYERAVANTGTINAVYNIVTFSVAFALVAAARRLGAKWVHALCLWCATVGLFFLPLAPTLPLKWLAIVGLGIAWASIMGVPYIMIVRMVPSTRYGVYMGIVNMMIVIPQLIQTLTFGSVYKNLLGDNPNNAMWFAGAFLAIAGLVMLWIKEPPTVRDVDEVGDPAVVGGSH